MKLFVVLILAIRFAIPNAVASQSSQSKTEEKPLPGIEQKTAGMQKFPGFFTYYWDARAGKIWLQIDKWDADFLFHESLPNGVGSNDIGLDRGQPGRTYLVHFERSGKQALLVAENEEFRAVTDDAEQQRAVREAFAQSVLWGFEIAAEDGDAVLVDATPFFLSDTHEVAARIADSK